MRRRKRIEPFLESAVSLYDGTTDGQAIGRTASGKVVFVQGGIAGDVADVWIFADKGGHFEGRLQQLLTPSPERVAPQCQHFGTCGGCRWQHQSYAGQLIAKEKLVKDAYERIAEMAEAPVRPIIGAPKPFGYRNKLEFTFSPKRWLDRDAAATVGEGLTEARSAPALGFHAPGAFDRVLHIDKCWLMPSEANDLRNRMYELAMAQQRPFYDARSHEGWLRQLVLRKSEYSGQWLVTLIIAFEQDEWLAQLFAPLQQEFPFVAGWVSIVNSKHNDSFSELPWRIWAGTDTITELVHGVKLTISPTSFFQTNTQQALRLYDVALTQLRSVIHAPISVLYDLYCGTGSIGLAARDLATVIYGIEYVEASVTDARINAERNEVHHINFIAGDMAKVLTSTEVEQLQRPTAIITDPPRAGMDVKVCDALLRLEPEAIVYVSCNVATQARDVAILSSKYVVLEVQPVDMFPQTGHVEVVTLLTRRR